MKTVKILAVTFLLLCATNAMAQKFGSVKQADLIQKMMTRDSVPQKVDSYIKELTEVADAMQQEFSTKLADYQKGQAGFSEAIRQQKEKDLQRLQQSIEEFSQSAQANITKKQNELMEPIIKQFRDAVSKVGKEGTYLMVFSNDQPLYVSETLVTDVTEPVRKVIGVN